MKSNLMHYLPSVYFVSQPLGWRLMQETCMHALRCAEGPLPPWDDALMASGRDAVRSVCRRTGYNAKTNVGGRGGGGGGGLTGDF